MRPILFGYFRVRADDAESAVSLRSRFSDHADCEGYELSNVFMDNAVSGQYGLAALLRALRGSSARHVLVPGLDHLTRFSYMQDHVRRTLESVTGATVLTLPPRVAVPVPAVYPRRSLSPVSAIVAPLAAPGKGR